MRNAEVSELLAGPRIAANDAAFAVAGAEPGSFLISTTRPVARWSELSATERADVWALLDTLTVTPASVGFDTEAPDGAQWHLCLRRLEGGLARLPAFVGGEEQRFLPALQTALALADEADLLSAFIQTSGVALLRDDLEDALRRGARVRVLTGDYLGITAPAALRELCELTAVFDGLKVRVYRCTGVTAFHAKAYIFVSGAGAVAYVGSSNLSRAALTSSVEWNLRAIHGWQAGEVATIRARFEKLWAGPEAVPLTPEWIDGYTARLPIRPDWDPPAAAPEPHEIQRDALTALAQTRQSGALRGLVVLATGLGKTLLAAFDALQMGARRVLFVAHRDEIITQARRAFAVVFPARSAGLFKGASRDRDTELLFATVQTLSRPEHLASFSRDHFDLIVIDEFHHAAALSYRRILGYFEPRFFLGLTATPERGDGTDLLHLCADNLVFRADLAFGITRGRLVPFVYHGLKDSVDYKAIPWRSGRFDPAALSRALATITHAQQALRGYREHGPAAPRRGLWFCASIAHAEFMAAFLRDSGIRAVAVHSEKGGAPRAQSLRALMSGELEAITTVDVFNEGIDVPDINVVVLLRPTESRVVFLQQIGRGLRLPERSIKRRLVILDFIGNHRSFLARPAALMSLFGASIGDQAAIRRLRDGDVELPAGCSVHLETEVVDLLARLGAVPGDDRLIAAFLQLRDTLGRRPTLTELVSGGFQAGLVTRAFGSWWEMLAHVEELSADEARVFAVWRDELVALEEVRAPASAPWATLRAWIERGGVTRPVNAGVPGPGPERHELASELVTMWRDALSRVDGAVGLRRPVDDRSGPVLEAMIDEVCAAFEREARRARRVAELPASIPVRVLPNGKGLGPDGSRRLMLKYLGSPQTPRGPVEVRVAGEPFTFFFMKIAVNVATTRPKGPNLLAGILRGVFGEDAGASGMDHRAVLREIDGQWTLIPLRTNERAESCLLPYYTDLMVACGLGDTQHADAHAATSIRVDSEHRIDARRHFVVRARGDSMDGGDRPIRDGDRVLCAWLPVPLPDAVDGKPCLLVAHDGPDASEAMIKVPTRTADGTWVLRSWSKGQADIPVARWEALRVVARVIEVVQRAD